MSGFYRHVLGSFLLVDFTGMFQSMRQVENQGSIVRHESAHILRKSEELGFSSEIDQTVLTDNLKSTKVREQIADLIVGFHLSRFIFELRPAYLSI